MVIKLKKMKILKKKNWVFSFENEWKQLGTEQCNWYSFTLINIYFENEVYTGGIEMTVKILGLGVFIRYNYDFEGSKVGKIVKKLDKK